MSTMKDVHDAQTYREECLAHARSIADTAPAAELRSASLKVEAAQRAVSDAVTDGANPCAKCGEHPHGMVQPRGKGGPEFEIGCLGCPGVRVRGGMIPRHAVEAWNEGPGAKP